MFEIEEDNLRDGWIRIRYTEDKVMYLDKCGHFCEYWETCCACRQSLVNITKPCAVCAVSVKDFTDTMLSITDPDANAMHKNYMDIIKGVFRR